MTLDTGMEVAREKFHLLPMPDVVILHLNALAAKDKSEELRVAKRLGEIFRRSYAEAFDAARR